MADSINYLTPDELGGVLKLAMSESSRDHAMILAGFRHGMRASEICGLKFDDLDTRQGFVTIRRLKGSVTSMQAIESHAGRPELDEKKAFKRWLADRPSDKSSYVFTSQKGGRLDRSQFYRRFRYYAEKAGLPTHKQHPHCLKHSLGHALAEANVGLSIIQTALGHRCIDSTAVYAKVSDEAASARVAQTLMDVF